MKQNRKMIEKKNEIKNWFFEEINKMDKTGFTKRNKNNLKFLKSGVKEAITTNLPEIKGLLENTADNCMPMN